MVPVLLSLVLLITVLPERPVGASDPILVPKCGTDTGSLIANASLVAIGSSGTIMFSCGSAGFALAVTGSGSLIPEFSLPSPYSSLALSASTTCSPKSELTPGLSLAFGTGSGMLPITSYDYCASFSNVQSTGLPSFAITWSSPTTSVVGCGHDLSCSVQSNSTLSHIKFAGNTIHVQADGAAGTNGFANVTVPKSAIPHIETVHVFVDNSKLDNSHVTISNDSTNYYIYFTFTFHSPVLIDIQLTVPENAATPNILGLDPTIFYAIVGFAAAVVFVVAGFAYRARSKPKPIVS